MRSVWMLFVAIAAGAGCESSSGVGPCVGGRLCIGSDVYTCTDGSTEHVYSHTCSSDLVCDQGACRVPGPIDANDEGVEDAAVEVDAAIPPDGNVNPACDTTCSSACTAQWCSDGAGVCTSGSCRACRTGDRTCDDGSLWLLQPGRPECATTIGAQNDFHSGFCAGTGPGNPIAVGGTTPDNVWIFNPTVDGTYTVTLHPEGAWDAILYIAESFCQPPIAADCIGFSNKTGPGGTESLTFPALSDTSYHIAVDGLDVPAGNWAKTGRYRISLTGP